MTVTPDAQPSVTVAGQSIALNVTGYPDIPNRRGPGSIRVTAIRLDYGSSVSPDARRAFITGLWVNEDDEITEDPLDQQYDAIDGNMSDWPDEIAELARKHTPVPPGRTERALAAVRRLCEATIAVSVRTQAIQQARDTLTAIDHAMAADRQPDARAPRCSCGGQFPLHHLNADTHDPITPAQEA